MAWYYGTFACGHEGRTNIIGPIKDREWKAERAFAKICSDCYKKLSEELREQENKEAAERAKEMNLPELAGTEKQVAWANTIRQKLIEAFDDTIERMNDEDSYKARLIKRRIGVSIDEVIKIREFIIHNRSQAKYYIDNRYNTIEEYIEAELQKISAVIDEEDRLVEEAKAESTVYPENRITDAVVEIIVQTDKISIVFEKNEEFRSIVKSLGYKWDDRWVKKITETTGTVEERAAELGNKLLNAGFPICIFDENIRERAVNGTYKPECKRWIYHRKDTNYLAINWTDRSDIYEKVRSLPGSKWDNPSVLVRVEHFEEIEDFASLYGFRFTKAAQNLIEQQKERLEKAVVVKPTKSKEHDRKDGLSDILQSSDDVLPDLIEED
jgi:hypothetical protein